MYCTKASKLTVLLERDKHACLGELLKFLDIDCWLVNTAYPQATPWDKCYTFIQYVIFTTFRHQHRKHNKIVTLCGYRNPNIPCCLTQRLTQMCSLSPRRRSAWHSKLFAKTTLQSPHFLWGFSSFLSTLQAKYLRTGPTKGRLQFQGIHQVKTSIRPSWTVFIQKHIKYFWSSPPNAADTVE
jgi:hypothetical protein